MPLLTNMLISASAGTGKTYQLSLRFLGLLALNGGNHPDYIHPQSGGRVQGPHSDRPGRGGRGRSRRGAAERTALGGH